VHRHAGMLRAGIGTSGNEHRLGANEAPPAIISVFMGQMLTRVIEEIAVVSPRIVVVMGERALATLNDFDLPLAARIDPRPGEVQSLTPTIGALYTPDIDAALDDQAAKQEFWRAFRSLGEWWEEQPPY